MSSGIVILASYNVINGHDPLVTCLVAFPSSTCLAFCPNSSVLTVSAMFDSSGLILTNMQAYMYRKQKSKLSTIFN